MYLDISEKQAIGTEELVGIFDLDGTSISNRTREFLKNEQEKGRVLEELRELPRSFLVSRDGIYLSPVSTTTLKRRILEEKN